MDLTLPEFDGEFRLLGPLWPVIWDAVEYGCDQAEAYFADVLRVDVVDASLAPEIQRYHARTRLVERGVTVDDLALDELGRNGIGFWFKSRYVRLWKHQPDGFPRANSEVKLNFLNQQLPFAFYGSLVDILLPNRWIRYEVDARFRLKALWFALPSRAIRNGPSEVYWVERITFDMIDQFGSPAPANNDDANESDNLDLELKAGNPNERDDPEPEQFGVGS
jgi:hypothetical protein